VNICMTPFAERQYRPDFGGTCLKPEWVQDMIQRAESATDIRPGYADFNKIIVLDNRDQRYPLRLRVIPRAAAIAQSATFHTAYEARRPEELPVLAEWVTGVNGDVAPYVHLIVYSRAQLELEDEPVTADWGIVSINAGAAAAAEPMRPITMMRNALGVAFGGSGHDIDEAAYRASAAYWTEHIMIREP